LYGWFQRIVASSPFRMWRAINSGIASSFDTGKA